MNSNFHFVILHGSFGNPNGDWFPWLAKKLSDLGWKVTVPAFPTPENQNLDNWLNAFYEQVGEPNESMILIGHSISVPFILRILERSKKQVKAAFLIAAFVELLYLTEFDKINHSFVVGEVNWEKVLSSCSQFSIYNSDNDPYVPLWMGQRVAHHLRSSLNVIPYAGHFNASAGCTTFDRLFNDIEIFLNQISV